MDFVALDFETANEQRDSACAVGLAVVRGGRVVRTHFHLVRPSKLCFSRWNTRIHGITESDVAHAPTLGELWPTIWQVVEGQLIVAHNASFDMSVLRHSLHANNVGIPDLRYLCSLAMARIAWPRLTSHSLGFLAATHDIPLDHHNAKSDACAASEIVLKIACELSIDCPLRLAEELGVSVGRLLSNGDWIPSSAPRLVASANSMRLALPEGFDISKHPLYGKSLVFTGTLKYLERSQAMDVVKVLGGNPKTNVTKNTDIVVTGVQDLAKLAKGECESSKLRKARELRSKGRAIHIMTDDEFMHLLSQLASDD